MESGHAEAAVLLINAGADRDRVSGFAPILHRRSNILEDQPRRPHSGASRRGGRDRTEAS